MSDLSTKRPYWLIDAKIENGVYLGFTRGQWPIQAISAESPDMAARWCAEDACNRVVIGPVPIPPDTPTWASHTVPAHTELVPNE